jgi:nucleoside-diphosphate-sugar epimerase
MKVLVLGGSRFIGRRLVSELLERGDQVTLFNRGRSPDRFGERVNRIAGDRRSASDLSAAFSGREFDAAYDFLSFTSEDARLAIDALSGRTGHFIHINTCSVYWCTGYFPCPVPEEAFDRHGDFEEREGSIEYDYGYNKRKAEETLFAAHRENGFPATAVRLPNVAGEEDPTLRYASYVMRVADGGPLVIPDGGYAPFRHVYVGDAARALAGIPTRPQVVGRAYNLASHEILSVRRLVADTARLLDRRIETVDVPSSVLELRWTGADFSPFSKRAAQIPSIARARRELDWSPSPYETWIEATVLWSRKEVRKPGVLPPAYAGRDREIALAEWFRRTALERPDGEARDGTSARRRG